MRGFQEIEWLQGNFNHRVPKVALAVMGIAESLMLTSGPLVSKWHDIEVKACIRYGKSSADISLQRLCTLKLGPFVAAENRDQVSPDH